MADLKRWAKTMIRAAKVEDCARIGEIHVAGWRAAYRGIVPDSLLASLSSEKRAAGWRVAVERDPGSVLLAEEKDVIMGWAAFGRCREGTDITGELFAIYVDPALLGKGIGKSLMAEAEATLWQRGFQFCVLWVLERNLPTRSFYSKLGYSEDGGRKSEVFDGLELVELRMKKQRPNQALQPTPMSVTPPAAQDPRRP